MTMIDTAIAIRATHRLRVSPRALAAQAGDRLAALVLRLLEWQELARQRRQLLALPDGALKDFGASRADAEGEAGKPGWRS